MRAWLHRSSWSALALPSQARTHAASVVIYRCTAASGAVTLQNNVPCPKGSQQQKQVIESPPPMPAYLPPPMPVAVPEPVVERAPWTAAADDAPSTIADKDRLPPPALYQCNTYDNDSYLSETATAGTALRAPGDRPTCRAPPTMQRRRLPDGHRPVPARRRRRRLRCVEAAPARNTVGGDVRAQR